MNLTSIIKKKWLIHFFFQTFHESEEITSVFLQKIYVLFYFGQVFSVLFKKYLQKFTSQSITIFSYLLFGFDFSNYFIYFKSDKVFLTIFYLTFALLLTMLVVMLAYSFLWRKIVRRKAFFLNTILKNVLLFFFWMFYVPVINLFMNIFENSWFSFHDNQKFSFTEYIIAFCSCFLAFLYGVIILYFNTNYIFSQFNGLRIGFNVFWFLIFLSRTFLFIISPFLQSSFFVIYFFLAFFCLVSIYHYTIYYPIKNKEISSFYLGCLFSYMVLTMEFYAYYYLSLLNEENLFYVLLISCVTAFKLGAKLQRLFHDKILIKQFKKGNFIKVHILEEISLISDKILKDNLCRSLFLGLLFNHSRKCQLPECHTLFKRIQIAADGADSFTLNELINCFIEIKFRLHQKKQKKATFIYKYISFYHKFEPNQIKALYEMERVTNLFHIYKKHSYFEILCDIIREGVVFKLKNSAKTKTVVTTEKKKINLTLFFGSLKLKDKYEKDIKEILNEKCRFWDAYLTSIQKMQDLLSSSSRLTAKIERFQEKINKSLKGSDNDAFKFINLKTLTIFHSVIINSINVSMKYEEELDLLLKNTNTIEKELTQKSFMDKNTAPCMLSFTNNIGVLKNQQKNVKLGRIFGYSAEDMKKLHQIEDLMPKIIRDHHSGLVETFIHGTKKKSEKYKGKEKVYIKKITNANSKIIQIEMF